VLFTSWAFRQTPECALSMSTFSAAWEVVAGAAGAVDACVGGREAVVAVPFGLVVRLLLRGGSYGRTLSLWLRRGL
jgi:hypothetical protein